MSILREVKNILGDILQLGVRVNHLNEETLLLGNLPELDSMAVVSLITALEKYYQFTIDDDEIDAQTFESVGSLVDFVTAKLERHSANSIKKPL